MPILKTVTQAVVFKATPEEVYTAIMDPTMHSAFTDAAAIISPKIGGKISMYGNYIEGSNVRLTPGKQIVQRWRADNWPEGHYSTVTFTFKKVKSKTEMQFIQTGIPVQFYVDTAAGWKKYYWERMKAKFGW